MSGSAFAWFLSGWMGSAIFRFLLDLWLACRNYRRDIARIESEATP